MSRLRFSFINLRSTQAPGSAQGSDPNSLVKGKAKVLAQVFSEPFQVYSAKKFPVVCESTQLSKCFASQGVKIPIRKEGKLPRETYRESYQLEYGSAVLEIHTDDVARGSRVLVVDDILATGGTLEASAKLLHRAGLHIAGFGLLMELTDQRGRGKLGGHRTRALYRV